MPDDTVHPAASAVSVAVGGDGGRFPPPVDPFGFAVVRPVQPASPAGPRSARESGAAEGRYRRRGGTVVGSTTGGYAGETRVDATGRRSRSLREAPAATGYGVRRGSSGWSTPSRSPRRRRWYMNETCRRYTESTAQELRPIFSTRAGLVPGKVFREGDFDHIATSGLAHGADTRFLPLEGWLPRCTAVRSSSSESSIGRRSITPSPASTTRTRTDWPTTASSIPATRPSIFRSRSSSVAPSSG